ncbi:MAG: tetratricopeptide repeat protein [Parasphingorhabdus sp.]
MTGRIWKSGFSLVLITVTLTGCKPSLAEPPASTASSAPQILSDYQRGRDLLYDAKDRFEYPKATDLLERAVAQDDDNVSAKLDLLYAYSKRSKYEKAKVQIAALMPRKKMMTGEQLAWFEALSARVANDKPVEIGHWIRASQINPNNRWSWYELASAHASAEQYAQAADAAEKAIAVEPDHSKWESSWIHYLHSKALFRSGQYDKAIPAATAGKGNSTTLRSTYFREVIARIAVDRSIEIQPYVDEYIRISNSENRNSPHYTRVNISLFYFELGMLEQAVSYAKQALELDDSAYANWALGFALVERGEARQALPLIESSLAKYPEDTMLWAAKAMAQYRLDDVRQAKETITIAVSKSTRENNLVTRITSMIDGFLATKSGKQGPKLAWLD